MIPLPGDAPPGKGAAVPGGVSGGRRACHYAGTMRSLGRGGGGGGRFLTSSGWSLGEWDVLVFIFIPERKWVA